MTPALRQQVLREWRPYADPELARPKPALVLNELVPRTMQRLGLEQRLWESQIFTRWSELVGEVNARICQPVSLRNGRLTINVAHSTWLQELRPLKPQMLAKIQKHVGARHVRDLILRNG